MGPTGDTGHSLAPSLLTEATTWGPSRGWGSIGLRDRELKDVESVESGANGQFQEAAGKTPHLSAQAPSQCWMVADPGLIRTLALDFSSQVAQSLSFFYL